MIVQLLRERNAEAPQFSLHELELFQRHFRDYGVSLKSFQKIVSVARWESVHEGDTIVRAGVPLDRVLIVHDGNASAYKEGLEGELRWREKLYEYEGRGRNGCIIGGTALVDPRTTRHPYPQIVLATGGADEIKGGDSEALVGRESVAGARAGENPAARKYTVVVSWDREELKSLMEADKTLEAAFVHTLYIDLISGLRRQRTANKTQPGLSGAVTPSDHQPAGEAQQQELGATPISADAGHTSTGVGGISDSPAPGSTGANTSSSSTSVAEHAEQERIRERLQQYRDMLLEAIIDPEESEGFAELNPRKKRDARLFARREGISMAQHVATLSSLGWTRHEWMDGCREQPMSLR